MCWGGGVGWGRKICYTAVMIAPLDKRRLDRCSLFWWDSCKKGLLCPPRLTAPPWRPKKFSLWKIFNLYLYCNLPVCIPFKNLKKLEANRCLEERQMCILFTGKDCSTVYIHTYNTYSVHVSVLGTYQMLNLREYTVNVQIQHMFRSLVHVKKNYFHFLQFNLKLYCRFLCHCYKKIQPKKYL